MSGDAGPAGAKGTTARSNPAGPAILVGVHLRVNTGFAKYGH